MRKRLMIVTSLMVFALAATQVMGAIAMPPMTEKVLDNGLRVVVVQNDEQPVVSMRLLIKSGAAMDPRGKAGLANMTAELLRKGTTTRDATKVSQEIDFVGGSLGANAREDAMNVTCEVLTKHLDVGIDLLADVVLNPTFPADEVERLRKQAIAGLMSQKDEPGTVADIQFGLYLFGEHPYGQPGSGTIESVETITRDDIVNFWKTYFVPNNSVLYVAGAVTAAEVLPKIEAKLAGWLKGELAKADFPPANPVRGTTVILVNKPDATNANVKMGHLGIDRLNPDIYAVRLMNYILGGGGFRSRLLIDVRDKRGLTYGISSMYAFNRYPGEFAVTVATRTDSCAPAIAATIEHLNRMRDTDVTAQELSEAKSFYAGFFPRQFETPEQVADQLSIVELYGLEKDYLAKYIDYLNAVTPQQVRAVAQKYLDPNNLLIVVVGKAEALRDKLKQFGQITELELSDL